MKEDIHVIPIFEGEKDHEEKPDCWCEPVLEDYSIDGGSKLYVHNRIQ